MKIEVINENRVQITLTIDELNQRNLSLNDIEKDSKKARELFLDLIEESNIANDFPLEHSQIFIEATTDCCSEFIVTLTRVEDFPDLSKFDILTTQDTSKKSTYFSYYSNFSIFEFKDLDSVIKLANRLKQTKCYVGKNSLYNYSDTYFLVFSNYTIKNTKFVKTASLINEYCDNMYETGIFETSLVEKSKLILDSRAIQKLSKI